MPRGNTLYLAYTLHKTYGGGYSSNLKGTAQLHACSTAVACGCSALHAAYAHFQYPCHNGVLFCDKFYNIVGALRNLVEHQ